MGRTSGLKDLGKGWQIVGESRSPSEPRDWFQLLEHLIELSSACRIAQPDRKFEGVSGFAFVSKSPSKLRGWLSWPQLYEEQ